MPAVSSTDSVVWVTKPSAEPSGTTRSRACSSVSTSVTAPGGNCPIVPMTSGWPAWPIEKHMAAEPLMAHGLLVHLGDQRAGRVEIEQIARIGIRWHRFRHAMRGKDDRPVTVLRRDLRQFLDEDRALRLQPFDDIAIVDDLVTDIDRRAIFLQRQHDDLDGAVDAGAKAARTAKRIVNFFLAPFCTIMSWGLDLLSGRNGVRPSWR